MKTPKQPACFLKLSVLPQYHGSMATGIPRKSWREVLAGNNKDLVSKVVFINVFFLLRMKLFVWLIPNSKIILLWTIT